jgi:isopropylmalate/homocitrate/citramalate synthase
MIGKHSGKAALKFVLTKLGLTADSSQVDILLDRLRRLASEQKRACSYEEVKLLYNQINRKNS